MAEMSHMMLGLFWGFIVYNLALGVTKISIVFSYLRVFASTNRTRIACLVTLGLLVANTFQAVLTSVLSCNPVWLFWHPEKALLENPPMRYEDHCLNLKVMWFFQGSINIVFDFVLILLPMPVLKSLRISRTERYALMSIFALGGFGCIVSFLRLRSLHMAASSKDPGWDNVNSVRWSVIEVTVGIMCASLPQCKALITRLFPRWLPGGHRPPTMRNIAVSNYDKGHGWQSKLAAGIELDQMQRTQMSQKGGIVLSNVEKGTVDWDSSEDSGEASGAAAIIVTTTMTQRRESHCYDPEMFEMPRINSITPSQISLPPFLSAE
ncbi:hypothetical protein SLS56_010176 [Neofusicoccum ribis]|uniref:Rhodopsin domain-containing protein n=1 Tax=Neofusicoccum ribis TaxID=45134 RepID=A0ABR3SF45_9PEZI